MKAGLLILALVGLLLRAPGVRAADRVPVVVELFTSEGCSSCPPADALLAALARGQSETVEIIALGEHVDYWNELGWKDRFSDRQFSLRQEDYARRFGLGSVYTPQMVIDGRLEFVGNDQAQARRTIAASSAQKKPVAVILEVKGDVLNVEVKGPSSALVLLAITEDNLSTQVKAGENGGRRLLHQAVVRSMRQIGVLTGPSFIARETLPLEPSWTKKNLKAVVLAQEPRTGAILGAAARHLEP